MMSPLLCRYPRIKTRKREGKQRFKNLPRHKSRESPSGTILIRRASSLLLIGKAQLQTNGWNYHIYQPRFPYLSVLAYHLLHPARSNLIKSSIMIHKVSGESGGTTEGWTDVVSENYAQGKQTFIIPLT